MMQQLLINISIAYLGMLLIAVANAWKANHMPFKFSYWIEKNMSQVILSSWLIALVAVTLNLIPESATLLYTYLGIDVDKINTESRLTWLIFGISIYEASRKTKRKKPNKTNNYE